jgi:hypothetical protein
MTEARQEQIITVEQGRQALRTLADLLMQRRRFSLEVANALELVEVVLDELGHD